MADKLTPRSEDYSKWYTEIVQRAEMAGLFAGARFDGDSTVWLYIVGEHAGWTRSALQGHRPPERLFPAAYSDVVPSERKGTC